jgi:tyrosyl-tRNA synthetase
MYRKVMQLSDELMWRYYELLTDRSLAEIATLRRNVESGREHPMKAKMDLAAAIVTDFHNAEAARQGAEEFARVVQQGQIPEDIETVEMPAEMKGETEIRIDKLLRAIGLCASGAEANRKLKEGAVSIDGEKHREMSYMLDRAVKAVTIQVGKKWIRVGVG